MKLLKKLRYVPKRFAAIAAIIVAGSATALTFAWGPERTTFTVEHAAPYVTFNSITNNPVDGDERNFARAVEASSAKGDVTNVQAGKEYTVRMVVHNNAADKYKLTAENTKALVTVPTTIGKTVSVSNFVTATNANPVKVWDDVTFTSDKDFSLVYVPGSARIYNNGYAAGGSGKQLPDSLVTSDGAMLGYAKEGDGKIPGCFQYLSYVEYKVKPQFAPTTDFSIVKDVRKSGTTTYGQSVQVKAGDKVDFRIKFVNNGEATLNNVVIKDALPAGFTYVEGTAALQNANYVYPNVHKLDARFFGDGSNIGNYAKGINAFITFSATVNGEKLVCGSNTLTNKATVVTDYGSKTDDAVVTVTQDCVPTEKTIEVCRLSDKKYPVTIKESEFDSTKYSKNPADCQAKPVEKTVEVCRLSDKVYPVTIKESEFDSTKYSKNPNDCKETPAVLPSTGPEAILGSIVGSSALSYGAYSYLASRRALKNRE